MKYTSKIKLEEIVSVLEEPNNHNSLWCEILQEMACFYSEQIKNKSETMDIVPVVRCKDCKSYFKNAERDFKFHACVIENDDWYCAEGEKKER